MAAGDFTSGQRHEIDRAIRAAEQTSRAEFSVFVGVSGEEPRSFAEKLIGAMAAPDHSVLVMVDPEQRVLEVVTGSVVRRSLSDQSVQLAVIAMQSAFATGDMVGGIVRGITLLAEHARPQRTLHA